MRFFIVKDPGLYICTERIRGRKKKKSWKPEAKHCNKRQTVQDQAIFSPIKSVITVFLIYLMRQMISLPTCDPKVIAVTPAIELRREGAEKHQPPAFCRPPDGWRGAVSLGYAIQLTQPSASIWRRRHSWGLRATASWQAACWHLPTACCHVFPLFNISFSLSKTWFQDEEALLNQCDQDVPWIKKKGEGKGGRR